MVMLAYGGGSIKQNGVYDEVIARVHLRNVKSANVLDGVFSRDQSVIDEYLTENGVG
ncbi:MAG: hypothetical protein NC228_04305 [[Eubacterium] siraeum]|nr:hypothetical protein [[Eubacterium] siraeum]